MGMKKDYILTEILSFIEGGDKIIESIASFVIETKRPKHGGQGDQSLYESALTVEKEYIRYFEDIYAAIQKYGLNKIEESAFKPEHIDKIRGGISVVKGYINIPDTKIIFEIVKNLIINTREKLREVAKKIPEIKNITSLNKRLISLPLKTKWSDLNIKFINGNDIEITLRNDDKFKKILDYKELGFYDNKRKGPNLNWRIFTSLANYDGKMSWGDLGGVSETERLKKIDNFQKRKSEIVKTLRGAFDIDGDPFETFSDSKEYIIKITLVPENSNAKTNSNNWKNLMSDDELKKYDDISKKQFIKDPNNENEYLDNY